MAERKAKRKSNAGRPTRYKAEYCDLAFKYCLLGATLPELAAFFDVAPSTVSKWMVEHKEFSEAIRAGKEEADANVANRLYCRAMGYEHDDTDIRVVNGAIEQTPIRKYYPPDTTAAIFWLKNRQKAKWRDKTEVESTITGKLDEVKTSDLLDIINGGGK